MSDLLKSFIMMAHPAFAVFALFSTIWLIAEVLNSNDSNQHRIKRASSFVRFFMVLTWLVAGYWYVVFYGVDKTVIVHSSTWSFAHKFFMETKEHIFFIVLVLSLYLPIIVKKNNLAQNDDAKKLVIMISSVILVLSLYIEGAGAIVSQGVKGALSQKQEMSHE